MDSITGEYGQIRKPLIYYKGNLVALNISEESESYFGGNLPLISNFPETAKLHLLFTLNRDILDLFDNIQFSSIALIYPFMHDGGSIKYQIRCDGSIKIQSVHPREAENDWPYENYPTSFLKVKFAHEQILKMDFNDFKNLLPQGQFTNNSEEIIIVIPPQAGYEVSLWGDDGDAENVLCVFRICPKTGNVYADNQCS
ncbi:MULTISPECIES: hypothetical protein [Shewanella]|uniref:hypothetical protein n=1 Tax=Shewanella TaxID=22 RepID=UPI0021D89BB4|nr:MULTISPECIES: hypothetical protein [Shewanella]MCU8013220.1 hypothetical protein [Shewanella sp. SM74]MCU8086818.1 hypothetical protein [Shewanella sp. SM21]WVI94314.1 hypothetical protein VR487_04835 [Shewanella oncorhynchi]